MRLTRTFKIESFVLIESLLLNFVLSLLLFREIILLVTFFMNFDVMGSISFIYLILSIISIIIILLAYIFFFLNKKIASGDRIIVLTLGFVFFKNTSELFNNKDTELNILNAVTVVLLLVIIIFLFTIVNVNRKYLILNNALTLTLVGSISVYLLYRFFSLLINSIKTLEIADLGACPKIQINWI